MGAGRFVAQARKTGMVGRHGSGGHSLARMNTCSCHPIQWGLKKGLRRARRRLDNITEQYEER